MNPLVFDVSALHEGDFRSVDQEGPAPIDLGLRVIKIPEGTDLKVHADISHQGVVVNVNLTMDSTLSAVCAQCGEDFKQDYTLNLNQFVLTDPNGGGEEFEEEDLPAISSDDFIDLTQSVVDEMGTTLPFAPHCGCEPQVKEEVDAPDPRWAGLEKFL
ncbi:MAG: YceD family protein [Corynebacterium sp.]|nr:YceD family protein [Corynebacterium sp.]